jgi:hypothetical protein
MLKVTDVPFTTVVFWETRIPCMLQARVAANIMIHAISKGQPILFLVLRLLFLTGVLFIAEAIHLSRRPVHLKEGLLDMYF